MEYNERCANWGRDGVVVGAPDSGHNDNYTNLTDALANILHWASREGLNFDEALSDARSHFVAEVAEDA